MEKVFLFNEKGIEQSKAIEALEGKRPTKE